MKRLLSHNTLSRLKALQDKEERYSQDLFLIEGFKLFNEACRSNYPIKEVYIAEDCEESEKSEILTLCKSLEINPQSATYEEIKKITGMKTPEKVVAVGKLSACLSPQKEFDFPAIYLWELNDPGNLGTIIRTALWFGVKNIWLSPKSVDPFNLKAVRGSMGAIFRSKLKTELIFDDLLKIIRDKKVNLYVADKSDGDIEVKDLNKWVVVFGSESHGVPSFIKSEAKKIISIPGKGMEESLNVGVAVGIVLYKLSNL